MAWTQAGWARCPVRRSCEPPFVAASDSRLAEPARPRDLASDGPAPSPRRVVEQTASVRRELLHAARWSSTLARLLAAKACRTARCPVERRRLARGHRVAGPWSRHG